MSATMTDTTVARTILQQIGGDRFLANTGNTNLVAGDDRLTIRLRLNRQGSTRQHITSNVVDLYEIEYLRFSNPTAHNSFKGGTRVL